MQTPITTKRFKDSTKTQRTFLGALADGMVLLGESAWAANPSSSSKLNILIMYIDDMGYDNIRPCANKVNQTPDLDQW